MKQFDTIEDAISDIRSGKMVVVVDDEDRENEGDLIMAASKVTAKSVNFMAKEGRGLVCVPLTEEFTHRLGLGPMVLNNTDRIKTNFTVSVDLKEGTTTGISMSDRARTIKALTDKERQPNDFTRPGHVFPLEARKGGTLVRAGHTEAAVDLAHLAGLPPVGVVCEIIKDDGEMARLPELQSFCEKHGLRLITIRDLIAYRNRKEKTVSRIAETVLPTKYGDFQLIAYRSVFDKVEHIALVKGDVAGKGPVLTRVHSNCLTSEVFGSLRCDCGFQLDQALRLISKKGRGVCLYMRQFGRGIMDDDGMERPNGDIHEGKGRDLRDYGIGAQILADLGLHELQLLTNNPHKIVGLEGFGIHIQERVSLEVKPNRNNRRSLRTKKSVFGHLLEHV